MSSIALIIAGGTISMASDPQTNALTPANSPDAITDIVPELSSLARMEVFSLTDVDSSDITSEHWREIARTIHDKYDSFDGFVVTHGTDTMAYTASGLSFLLQQLSKPIILTGAQLPLVRAPGSFARNNLIHATMFATMNVAEVCICFAAKLMLSLIHI